jgi:hypothetical protein
MPRRAGDRKPCRDHLDNANPARPRGHGPAGLTRLRIFVARAATSAGALTCTLELKPVAWRTSAYFWRRPQNAVRPRLNNQSPSHGTMRNTRGFTMLPSPAAESSRHTYAAPRRSCGRTHAPLSSGSWLRVAAPSASSKRLATDRICIRSCQGCGPDRGNPQACPGPTVMAGPAWLRTFHHDGIRRTQSARQRPGSQEDPYRRRTRARTRRSTVGGHWHLWIYCCHWSLLGDTQLAHSESDDTTVHRALHVLDGQALTAVKVEPADGRTQFTFDLGCSLLTCPDPARHLPRHRAHGAVVPLPALRSGPGHPRRRLL